MIAFCQTPPSPHSSPASPPPCLFFFFLWISVIAVLLMLFRSRFGQTCDDSNSNRGNCFDFSFVWSFFDALFACFAQSATRVDKETSKVAAARLGDARTEPPSEMEVEPPCSGVAWLILEVIGNGKVNENFRFRDYWDENMEWRFKSEKFGLYLYRRSGPGSL